MSGRQSRFAVLREWPNDRLAARVCILEDMLNKWIDAAQKILEDCEDDADLRQRVLVHQEWKWVTLAEQDVRDEMKVDQ